MEYAEIGYEGVDWIHLDQSCEHGNEPFNSVKSWELLDQLSDC
jgi:hypothetical protein